MTTLTGIGEGQSELAQALCSVNAAMLLLVQQVAASP